MTKKTLTVTAPVAKATVAKPVVLDTPGYRAQVDALVSHKATLDACDAQIDAIRLTLDPEVTAIRARAEADGQFTKSVHLKGTHVDARYTFKDVYAPIDVACGPDLRRLLGPLYDLLFAEECAVSIVKGKGEELAALLGARADEFLKVEPEIRPVAEFRKARFEARDLLSTPQNAELDRAVVAVAAKPTLNLK
jgi:hypothetical protein